MLSGGKNHLVVLVPSLRFEVQSSLRAEEATQFRRRITMTSRVLRNLLLLPAALAVCAIAQPGPIGRHHARRADDPSITYSWRLVLKRQFQQQWRHLALTNAKGAQAAITFTGTGITWIGLSGSYSGIAWVYLDGTLNTVDTYTGVERYQQVLFSVRGLVSRITYPHNRSTSHPGRQHERIMGVD